MKLCDHIRMIHFWDKDKICDTPIFKSSLSLKNFLNDMNNARTEYVLVTLKEDIWEAFCYVDLQL